MKYKIVYDKPGRLRIRAGSFAFEKEQEGAVVSFLLSEPSISSAKAHFENGSILRWMERLAEIDDLAEE
jgi:hypothetical protein